MIVYELAVGLNYTKKCRKGYIWCTDGTFIEPSLYRNSTKTAYGYVLNNDTAVSLKRSTNVHSWPSAKLYCTGCIHSGKTGYLPDRYELKSLYNSIMSGKMMMDLIRAGIYVNCNYRLALKSNYEPNWHCIWSSTEYSQDYKAFYVDYNGYVCYYNDKSYNLHVIPFFKF